MVVVGVILLIVAAISFFSARGQSGRLRAMNVAETFTAQMLQDLYNRVVPSLGGEALSQTCEVTGTIEADTPLLGPVSGAKCVAYLHTVTREYEEDVTSTDSAGKTTTEAVRRSETVENTDRRTPFYVRDATGRVLLSPEGAELDLIESGSRFDASTPAAGERVRTLGYRHAERSLPVGAQVYVLGCAVDSAGQPAIARNPRDSKQKFIVSRRGERELIVSATRSARWMYYLAAGSGVLGIVLITLGVLR